MKLQNWLAAILGERVRNESKPIKTETRANAEVQRKETEAEAQAQELKAAQRIETSRKKLFEGNKDLIRKFLEIAERKVGVIDEYGDENWEILPDEINTCLGKIAKREGVNSASVKTFQKGKSNSCQ